MHEETFIREILAAPGDDVARRVYADWLEEQGDPVAGKKSEFLRLTVELGARDEERNEGTVGQRRLKELAGELDARWLAVVSHVHVENCRSKGFANRADFPMLQFAYQCDRGWQNLQTTQDVTVRMCDTCQQKVHYCDTIHEARRHAEIGHCVAIDLRVERRPDDLESRHMTMGVIDVSRNQGEEPFRWADLQLEMIALITSDRLSNLHELDLRVNRFGEVAARDIAAAALPNLELNLRNNRIEAAGVHALADSESLPQLARLDVRNNGLNEREREMLRLRLGRSFGRL